MKAAVLDEFGDLDKFQIREMPDPEPGDGQVLIEIHATSVNPVDWKMRNGWMAMRYGDDFPMILGWDCSGVVTAIGNGVTNFQPGEEVFARSNQMTGRCYAEAVALDADQVVKKPAVLSHDEAAALPMVAETVINGLCKCANLQAGQNVLIIGASGGVGTVAVQIAMNMGARVTGVCSAKNMELVASLGVESVIDYNSQDALAVSETYDIVYDTVGARSYAEAKQSLTANGTYLTLVVPSDVEFFTPGETEWEPGKGYFVNWYPRGEDLQLVADWAEEGKLRVIIDSVYQLEQIKEAQQRSETERAVGKIVVRTR